MTKMRELAKLAWAARDEDWLLFEKACSPERILAYEDCVEALRAASFVAGIVAPDAKLVARTEAALAALDALGEP